MLIKLNRDTRRTINIIDLITPLMGNPKFNLYYINSYDNVFMGSETVIIPGIGALSCFLATPHLNCAFYFCDKTAIDIYHKNLQFIIDSCANPLITRYSPEENHDYGRRLVENEAKIGTRFLFKNCFSIMTLSPELYRKLLIKRGLRNNDLESALDFYKKRLDAFITNVNSYEYYDIYLADSISNLIRKHQFFLYDLTGICLVDLEVADVVDILQNIINLLQTYEHYHIAIISSNHHNFDPKVNHLYYSIKERQAVALELYRTFKHPTGVRLTIEEPMMVYAYEEYLRRTWERIAPVTKDKHEVISWLQRQIDSLDYFECK